MSLAQALLGAQLADVGDEPWRRTMLARSHAALDASRDGRLPAREAALAALPPLETRRFDALGDSIRIGDALADDEQRRACEDALQALHPWRKGPFEFFGIDIDAEWRADAKWRRIAQAGVALAGASVLDVGCGNGYYALRMAGAGARHVVGVDPNSGHLSQFAMLTAPLRRAGAEPPVHLLPLPFEALFEDVASVPRFDVVFSMGVLYHRRDPLAHLTDLRAMLEPRGQLVLETIVVPGDADAVLQPEDRYARMRNVWQLPSTACALRWLETSGFTEVRCVDEGLTTVAEQRPTPWMRFESLAHALDPLDAHRTVEGHPAPRRALLVATRD